MKNNIQNVLFVRNGITRIVFENDVQVSVVTDPFETQRRSPRLEVAVFCDQFEFVPFNEYDDIAYLTQSELDSLIDSIKKFPGSSRSELMGLIQKHSSQVAE